MKPEEITEQMLSDANVHRRPEGPGLYPAAQRRKASVQLHAVAGSLMQSWWKWTFCGRTFTRDDLDAAIEEYQPAFPPLWRTVSAANDTQNACARRRDRRASVFPRVERQPAERECLPDETKENRNYENTHYHSRGGHHRPAGVMFTFNTLIFNLVIAAITLIALHEIYNALGLQKQDWPLLAVWYRTHC